MYLVNLLTQSLDKTSLYILSAIAFIIKGGTILPTLSVCCECVPVKTKSSGKD